MSGVSFHSEMKVFAVVALCVLFASATKFASQLSATKAPAKKIQNEGGHSAKGQDADSSDEMGDVESDDNLGLFPGDFDFEDVSEKEFDVAGDLRTELPSQSGCGNKDKAPTTQQQDIKVSTFATRVPLHISLSYKSFPKEGTNNVTVRINVGDHMLKVPMWRMRYAVTRNSTIMNVWLIRGGQLVGNMVDLPSSEWIRQNGDILVFTVNTMLADDLTLTDKDIQQLQSALPPFCGEPEKSSINQAIRTLRSMFALVSIVHSQAATTTTTINNIYY